MGFTFTTSVLFCLFLLCPNCYKHTINHVFYMDKLKFYARNDNDLKSLLDIVNDFINDN